MLNISSKKRNRLSSTIGVKPVETIIKHLNITIFIYHAKLKNGFQIQVFT